MINKWHAAAFFVSVFLGITECSASPTLLTQYETGLTVHDGVSREFHSSLYYPKGLALHYPGYLIGIQKGDQSAVHGPKLSCEAAGTQIKDCPFPTIVHGPEFSCEAIGAQMKDCSFPSYLKSKPEYFEQEKNTGWELGSLDLLKKIRSDSKSLFVAHITRFSFDKDSSVTEAKSVDHPYPYIDSCYLYNSFESPAFLSGVSDKTLNTWVDPRGAIAWKSCAGAPSWDKGEIKPAEFYDNGVPAIESLGRFVSEDLKKNGYTHILVLVMGWNTTQDEAIRNFNDITGNLIEAAKESEIAHAKTAGISPSNQLPFRPLVIGVSWPSYWSSSVVNPLSYPNKAHDADELGITWLNLLTNKVLPKAIADSGNKVPVILVGHSFGGRVVTRAVSASPALKDFGSEPYSGASLAIILEGAVSINRFWPNAGDEGAPLRDFQKLHTKFVFTASEHDKAAGGPTFWFDPSGSIKSYDLACGSSAKWRNEVFHCLRAKDNSGREKSLDGMNFWDGFLVCDKKNVTDCWKVGEKMTLRDQDNKVIYIDASSGITEFNTLGTAGDAHSDIYRLPMGRLLWMVINSLTPESR